MSEVSATATRPKRRWLQYGLRSLCILVTIAAVACGWTKKRLRDRRDAVIAVERAGGTIGYAVAGPAWLRKIVDDERSFWNPTQVFIGSKYQINDESLAALDGALHDFDDLEMLDIRSTRITDASAVVIGECTGIIRLQLSDTNVGDTTVRAIRNCWRLRSLHLDNTKVTDDCIDDLCQLSTLTKLSLTNTAITQSGIEALRKRLPNCNVRY